MEAHGCRICSGPLEPFHRGRGGRSRAGRLRALEPPSRASTATSSAAASAARCSSRGCRPATSCTTSTARWRTTEYLAEEHGPPRDRAAAARPDRRATRRPGGCSTSAAATGCCSTRRAAAATRSAGLELSRDAAGYARDVLGLEVREQPVEDVRGEPAARVRRDRPRGRDRAPRGPGRRAATLRRGCWRPAGRSASITPDPSSPTARAGRRALVGLRARPHVPAPAPHAARAAGRARARRSPTDVPLVRSFALRYWMAGLAERGGRAGRPLRRRRGRRRSGAATVSLSLGDERVVLAQRSSVARPARAARVTTAARRRASRRAAGLPGREHDRRASPRRCRSTRPTARCWSTTRARTTRRRSRCARASSVLRHPGEPRLRRRTRRRATCAPLLDGADIVVMVHADNQYDPSLVERDGRADRDGHRGRRDRLAAARGRDDRRRDAALEVGRQPRAHRDREPRLPARVLRVPHRLPRLLGRLPARDRRSCATPTASCSTRRCSPRSWRAGRRVVELPIPTRYFLEASSVSFRASVAYGLKTLWVLVRFRLHQRGRAWPRAAPPAARLEPDRRARRSGGWVSAEAPAPRPRPRSSPATRRRRRRARSSSSPPARCRSRSRPATSGRRLRAASRSRSHCCSRSACSRTPGSSPRSCARRAGRRSGSATSSANALAIRLALAPLVVLLAAGREHACRLREQRRRGSTRGHGAVRHGHRLLDARRRLPGAAPDGSRGSRGRGRAASRASELSRRRRGRPRLPRRRRQRSRGRRRRADDHRRLRAPAGRAAARVRPRRSGANWCGSPIPLGLTLAIASCTSAPTPSSSRSLAPASDVGLYALSYRIYELLAILPAIVMTSVFPCCRAISRTTAPRQSARYVRRRARSRRWGCRSRSADW